MATASRNAHQDSWVGYAKTVYSPSASIYERLAAVPRYVSMAPERRLTVTKRDMYHQVGASSYLLMSFM